jgi:opine dehydrogenase
MNICICGGGNLGHTTAGYIASKADYNVSILTRHPEKWSKELLITLPDTRKVVGRLYNVSSNPSEVIPSADLVLICLPGMYIREELERIKQYLRQDTAIGTVVSSTGFFFQAHDVIPRHILFGFQRVPFISRIIEYGHEANLLGFKKLLKVVIENTVKKRLLCSTLSDMFDTPVELLDNFYEVSLSNSNPLLHPSRLYTMWKDWHEGIYYPMQNLFYEDWTEEAAQLYIDMDREFQQLLHVLGVKKESLPPVLEYYESYDAMSLCRKIRSIKAFKGIKSPMVEMSQGWIPDTKSRYFTEDFEYGLRYIEDLLNKHHLDAPNINKIYSWGQKVISK